MPRQFVLPDLGEGITEAQVIRLLIEPGEVVAEDQYLMEVETDKAAVEIPSPYAGIAQEIHVQEGATVNVGDVIVTFDGTDGAAAGPATKEHAPAERAVDKSASAAPKSAPPPPAAAGRTRAAAAPAVRKLAREMNIDLDAVKGTGPGGRITREDLQRHKGAPGLPAAPTPAGPRPEPAAPLPGTSDNDKWGPIRRQPLRQIRKTIATQMTRSAFTIPHVTHMDEADISELDRMRRTLNEATGGAPKLTAMTFLVRACCLALGKYPAFNASFDDDAQQIIYKDYINMGIAVDTERGLIVPVIRNADKLGLRAIAAALRGIADRIRSGEFAIDDLRGGTFTITNVGALGGLFSTPLINYPEVAILGLGRSRKVAVIREGKVAEALTLPLSLSFDHRATDGANAARFTGEVKSYLETPAKYLLD